jgi:Ni,Fe-hydrogenase III large subunit
VLADDVHSRLYVSSTLFKGDVDYPAFTPGAPALHLFEREYYEQFGIEPLGHPWLKPVRQGIAGSLTEGERPYPFFRMKGEEIHEVGVGPIHAGIIEPGHFRFSCHGEDVYHLEIQHGFQHRGVEDLFIRHAERPGFLLSLAESIAGDSVIGHAGAYVHAMEALGNIAVTRQAMTIRTIALELERVAMHLGDLAALANDVAYLTGNAVFGALRTKVINTALSICGSRFGRGLLTPGGVNFDISRELREQIGATITELEEETELAAEVLFASASVLSRFERTGIITADTARQIGMVGPAARASGLAMDVRSDHPYGGFSYFPVHKMTLNSGDVFARAYIRHVEIRQSLRIIQEQLTALNGGELKKACSAPAAGMLVVSLVEGWRGEIAHIAITDEEGKLQRYKIKDPSFHNWFALALAVRKNGISDFPVINKSFNLSFCGMDL